MGCENPPMEDTTTKTTTTTRTTTTTTKAKPTTIKKISSSNTGKRKYFEDSLVAIFNTNCYPVKNRSMQRLEFLCYVQSTHIMPIHSNVLSHEML